MLGTDPNQLHQGHHSTWVRIAQSNILVLGELRHSNI